MDFSVQRTVKQTITIYGASFEVSPLTAKERETLIEKQENLGEAKASEFNKFAKEFMSMRGVPLDVLDSMEVEHWDALLQFFTGQLSKKS